MKGSVFCWKGPDRPFLLAELVHRGDTHYMPLFVGFSYNQNLITSEKQYMTYYVLKEHRSQATKFGGPLYKDMVFVKKLLGMIDEKSSLLRDLVDSFSKEKLRELTKERLWGKYIRFFESYAAVLGLYRFTQAEFYEDAMCEETKGMLELIGKKRLETHALWQYAFATANILFDVIAEKIGTDVKNIPQCLSKELQTWLLEGEVFPKEILEKRQKGYQFQYNGNSFKVTYDIAPEVAHTESFVRGITGYKGSVKGPVVVIHNSFEGISNMKKITEGCILVTENTNPDIVPYLGKVKAIVVEETGLLSHAAIVSREFNIPCVIGTKIATKIFKDGDIVEVDANKGIVRKIS
jgi:phosphohistidine swiveling domain-containing protein